MMVKASYNMTVQKGTVIPKWGRKFKGFGRNISNKKFSGQAAYGEEIEEFEEKLVMHMFLLGLDNIKCKAKITAFQGKELYQKIDKLLHEASL